MDIQIPHTEKKRVVIIGGGFGGITLANKLNSKKFQVILIDKNNYHQFQPLLYQVASAGLDMGSISFPYRKMFNKKKDFHFRLTEVEAIFPDKKKIKTAIGEISYDYLVIATGTTTNFFGNKTIEQSALPMKSVEEALTLRNHILVNLEKALDSIHREEKESFMNIVIVGGGATGVEISGALSEMKRYVIPKDYPDLKSSAMNIYLIEGSPRLLSAMSNEASSSALESLKKMGVKVMLNKLVTDYKEGKVVINDGETIPTKTLIWVSGVIGEKLENIPSELFSKGNRITVNEYNQLSGNPEIFVIGDICLVQEEAYPKGHPQVAPVAIQQGELLAKNLEKLLHKKSLQPFRYNNQGTLATIGRNSAVADIHKIKLHGFPAWAVWMLVHLRSILGVKNKLIVLIDWVWNYFTYDQSMRFILFNKEKHTRQKNP